MERDIKKIISEMTLEEKAGMCSGEDFWRLKGVERPCGKNGCRLYQRRTELGRWHKHEALCGKQSGV